MAMKATPTPEHLVSLCPWHHTGMKAGGIWEVQNRDRIRKYLVQLTSPIRTYR